MGIVLIVCHKNLMGKWYPKSFAGILAIFVTDGIMYDMPCTKKWKDATAYYLDIDVISMSCHDNTSDVMP